MAGLDRQERGGVEGWDGWTRSTPRSGNRPGRRSDGGQGPFCLRDRVSIRKSDGETATSPLAACRCSRRTAVCVSGSGPALTSPSGKCAGGVAAARLQPQPDRGQPRPPGDHRHGRQDHRRERGHRGRHGDHRASLSARTSPITSPSPRRPGGIRCDVFREGLVRDYALEIRHRDGHVTPVLYNARCIGTRRAGRRRLRGGPRRHRSEARRGRAAPDVAPHRPGPRRHPDPRHAGYHPILEPGRGADVRLDQGGGPGRVVTSS